MHDAKIVLRTTAATRRPTTASIAGAASHWLGLFEALTEHSGVPGTVAIDATHIEAHRSAAAAKGCALAQAIGSSRAALPAKIHGLTDDQYCPRVLLISAGNINDITRSHPLIDAAAGGCDGLVPYKLRDECYSRRCHRAWRRSRDPFHDGPKTAILTVEAPIASVTSLSGSGSDSRISVASPRATIASLPVTSLNLQPTFWCRCARSPAVSKDSLARAIQLSSRAAFVAGHRI